MRTPNRRINLRYYINTNKKNKLGESPIILNIQRRFAKVKFSTGVSCKREHWNPGLQLINSGDLILDNNRNISLNEIKSTADNVLSLLMLKKHDATVFDVKLELVKIYVKPEEQIDCNEIDYIVNRMAKSDILPAFYKGGIYFIYEGGKIIYIGESARIGARLADHTIGKQKKAYDFVKYISLPNHTKQERQEIESAFIRYYKPKYNTEYRMFDGMADVASLKNRLKKIA